MKRDILFNSTGLMVHTNKGMDAYSSEVAAVLEISNLSILLDSEAAEVLTGYLQLMRAYLSNHEETRQHIPEVFEKIATKLDLDLKFKGKKTAGYKDIKDLIQKTGCLHDWATKKISLLKGPQILE